MELGEGEGVGLSEGEGLVRKEIGRGRGYIKGVWLSLQTH